MNYAKTRDALREIGKDLALLLGPIDDESLKSDFAAWQTDLDTDLFSIVVVGGVNRGKSTLPLFLTLLLGTSCTLIQAQDMPDANNPELVTPSVNRRVEGLLRRMTPDEKIGQLSLYSAGRLDGPATMHASFEDLIARGEVGALSNAVGADRTNALQRVAIERSRLHIPLLLGKDIIHGDRTIFPIPLGLAASFDPTLVERMSRLAAEESRADGINLVFSPMVDIARDGRWGRVAESAGEDVLLGTTMAAAYVRGYQGKSLGDLHSVAACVKHYAAYGAGIGGRDYNTVDMSEWTLREVYLPTYEAAVKAGAAALMTSFNSLNGLPVTADPFMLRKILRQEWGFDGLVVSDWGAIPELIAHGVAANEVDAAAMAMRAGVDIDLEGDLYRNFLKQLVQHGTVSEQSLDDAVRHVLRVKIALGLFENPYTPVTPAYVATPRKRKLARDAAEESFVLLQNREVAAGLALLPLRSAGSIALIGPLADSRSDMLGSWPGNGNVDDVVTLRQALSQRLSASGGKLLYAQGTEILGSSEAGFAEALNAAKQADTVVLALGEDGPLMSGEASSRTHIDLPGNQEKLLESIVATGKPVVLVLFNGRPLALPWAAEHVDAILDAWFPGIEGGPAVADILFGNANPSGKLPVSFPFSVGQEPLSYTAFPTGRPPIGLDYSHYGTSRDKFHSRYLDEPNTALFPFGWGLSYTSFSYDAPVAGQNQVSIADVGVAANGGVQVSVRVRNGGSRAGSEVVQLYLHRRVSSVEQPMRQLKAFQRVSLQPGESQTIYFKLGFEELSLLNRDLKRVVEPGQVDVYVGGNSLADKTASFTIAQ
jgi:beta-glucosidase